MEYWQNVLQIAKNNNLTHCEFSQKTGLATNYLSSVKKHKFTRPTANTMMKICKAFDLQPKELFNGADVTLYRESNKFVNTFWEKFIAPKVKQRKLTVSKLARESNVSRSYLSGIKNGYVSYPNPKTIVRLSRYFNSDPYQWFNWLQNNIDNLSIKIGDIENENIKQ
ncbi:helix-turn-helix transcriptional regulator [Apilactobacillus timberlakei]|uniref:helix-turn-helix transcriptional regulator n=1 Tax=Apilactobacillus timberlakei TaxID=2008380 RepID=UPI0015E86A0B|nr:helix-turn-helix transcriptional regulator [Apilactobacillus timberlakei]